MIASVSGMVEHAGLDRVVIVVGGVGMLVHTTPSTAGACRVGAEAQLATTLVVREDSLTLFGFATPDERDMFETVQSVPGVGPRIALAMISVMGPDDLRRALSAGDTKSLTKVPGIGPKSAQRLVLELKDKVGLPGGAATAAGESPVAGSGGGRAGWSDQVTSALTGLGYSAKQAADAVDRVAADNPEETNVSVLLRLALRSLRP